MNPSYGRHDIDTFIDVARAAVLVGTLDGVSRSQVEARIAALKLELQQAEPPWELMNGWCSDLKGFLTVTAHPTIVAELEQLPWP